VPAARRIKRKTPAKSMSPHRGQALEQLLKLRPNFRLSHVREIFHTRDLEWSSRIVAALREAGLPE
jgi:hypothetical protein